MGVRFFSLAPWAWLASGAALVLVAATVVLAVMDRDVYGALIFAALGYALVGSLILARRPGHRMGPLLCAIALAIAFSDFVFVYTRYTLIFSPGSLPFGTAFLWITAWGFAPAACLTAFVLPLVFPDGRLLSRRWRPVLWAALLIIPLSAVGRAFIPDNMGSSLNYLPNPYPIPAAEPVFEVMLLLAVGSGLIVLAAVSASVVLRWRRSGQVVRLQLKWFLATIPILVAGIIAFDFFPDPVTMAFGIAGGLLPVAIGVAVLRYRLYEIDVILSRAVLYAVLSVAVAVVYLAVVAIARGVFGVGRSLERTGAGHRDCGAGAVATSRLGAAWCRSGCSSATGTRRTPPWPGWGARWKRRPVPSRCWARWPRPWPTACVFPMPRSSSGREIPGCPPPPGG